MLHNIPTMPHDIHVIASRVRSYARTEHFTADTLIFYLVENNGIAECTSIISTSCKKYAMRCVTPCNKHVISRDSYLRKSIESSIVTQVFNRTKGTSIISTSCKKYAMRCVMPYNKHVISRHSYLRKSIESSIVTQVFNRTKGTSILRTSCKKYTAIISWSVFPEVMHVISSYSHFWI